MPRKTGILASLRRRGFDQSKVTPFTRGAHVGCSQCEALVINGHASHETGCLNKPQECSYCGDTYLRGQRETCSCFLEESNG